jgi:hypothetical protein
VGKGKRIRAGGVNSEEQGEGKKRIGHTVKRMYCKLKIAKCKLQIYRGMAAQPHGSYYTAYTAAQVFAFCGIFDFVLCAHLATGPLGSLATYSSRCSLRYAYLIGVNSGRISSRFKY